MKYWVWLVAILLLPPSVAAQMATGNVYGTVADESGAVLPGASISMTGAAGTRTTTSGAQGDFRFLRVDHGEYELAVSLPGFATVVRPIVVATGANVSQAFSLTIATLEETVSVTAATPVVDSRKLGTATTLSREEMQNVPQARDPWAILNQSSGVVVRDVNVGGSGSGLQALFRGQGAAREDNDYVIDGVQITDMWWRGGTTTYYDFDQFEEIQITTGGNDITKNTAGVAINMVTKRGTNELRGSARFLLTDSAGYFGILEQADPGFDEDDLGSCFPQTPQGFQ